MDEPGSRGKKGATKVSPDELNEQQLARLSIRLLAHVRWRAKRLFGWLGRGRDDLGLGTQCEDIAARAVESMFIQPEAWPRLSLEDILERLKSTANSDLVNLQQKLLRRGNKGETFAHKGEFLDSVYELPESAEEAVAFREVLSAIEAEILERDDGDGQLMALFDLARGDHDLSPSLVSQELGIPVRQVDNLKRKLRTLVNDVRRRLGETPIRGSRGAAR